MVLKRNTADLVREARFKEDLGEFLKEKDFPQWYRAYSSFQLQAADNLMAAIRDDVAQETTHRVRNCLTVLGLVPLLGSKSLKLLISLSGGNDLAFLWFLMEYHYKTPSETEYSLNEQLILSGIAHLDMVTTLRGLDTILPTGHKSKRTLSQFRAVIRERRAPRKHRRNTQQEKIMPYFEKLERPKQIKSTFMVKRPDFKVNFRFYNKYKDATYEPPNERNRWFTTYAFQESVRVARAEMYSYFDNLFDNIEAPNVSERAAIDVIDTALENMDNSGLKKGLCLHHQMEFEYLQNKKLLQKEVEQEKCLKSLELSKNLKQERLVRIHQSLEREVNMYRLKYREKAKDGKDNKKHLHVISDNNLSEHSIRDDDGHGIQLVCTMEPPAAETHSKHHSQVDLKASASAVDRSKPSATAKSSRHKSITSFSDIKSSASILSITDNQYIRMFDYGHENVISPTTSQVYFQAPTDNQPYKFHYEKIFDNEHTPNTKKFIKEAFVVAIENKNRKTPRQFTQMPNVSEVARKNADKIWDKTLTDFRMLYHDTRKAIGLQSVENMEAQHNILTNDNLPPDMPRLEYYDCEDKKLMHSMLEIALNHLAKNPKYVLASLPDCHKMPILREWIYQRYGKTYTQAERIADFALSKRMLRGLNNLKMSARIPKGTDISPVLQQSYKCHHHIKEKVARVRKAYFHQAGKSYMEKSRFMWVAMNNALCSISQREMFFAYMPQRINDLHLISPWKLNQRKEMAMIWERKELEKKKAATLTF